jgi:selenocysteine lyase/cysteine desulfurase
MAQEALSQVLAWGVDAIHDYISGLTRSIPDLARSFPFIESEDIDYVGHIRGIAITDDAALQSIKEKFREKDIHVSYRSNVIRIAPNVYNDQQDIDRLFECIAASVAG